LHVGTYDAAVHNMLRRIDDLADHGSQFSLSLVHLLPTITVCEGCLVDPSNFVGDVALCEVCPPGIDVARAANSIARRQSSLDTGPSTALTSSSKRLAPALQVL
jgi:hypothetical protein